MYDNQRESNKELEPVVESDEQLRRGNNLKVNMKINFMSTYYKWKLK